MKYLFKFYLNVQKDAEGRWLGFSGYQPGHELKLAYGGSVEADTDLSACERLFERFNINHPTDYRDRSMNKGDVVVLHSVKQFTGVAYSCESFGFKAIENFAYSCDVRLVGYQRISGQPVPVRCTKPRGHDGDHSDQFDGTPIDWSGDGTITHIEDPRVIKGPERSLTEEQQSVLAQLRKAGCGFLAACTEDHWKRGESYYIDSRVNVSKRLRAAFDKANPVES